MRFSQENSPKLSFFPQDGNTWRIDWFGDVSFPDRRQSYKHPSILLALSKVLNGPLGYSVHNRSTRSQRQIWAPVGLLPRLRIGDLWQDGRLVSHDSAQVATFHSVTINSQTCRVVKAGIDLNGQDFLLPTDAHPWHMRHTQSHCMLVQLPDDKRMVIPCPELIRFYFGSSNWLVGTLFSPPLDPRSLFRSASYTHGNGRLHLRLAISASGFSASDIGRIARDRTAMKAAAEIGRSLLVNSTRKEKAYPRALFPFTGPTDLTIRGEWLPLGDLPENTFLVHSIQSCTHPFPFQRLTYHLERPQQVRHIRHGQTRLSDAPSPLTNSQILSTTGFVANKDPSARLASGIWHENQGVRFPDLVPKAVFRILKPIDLKDTDSRHRPHKDTQLNTFAVGEPSGTNRAVRSLKLEVVPPSFNFEAAPEFLHDYLQQLVSISGIGLGILTESHYDGWSVPINAMQDDERSIDPKLYVKENAELRIRRACVLHVQHNNCHIAHIVLIEDRPTRGYLLKDLPLGYTDVPHCLEISALKFLTEKPESISVVLRKLRGLAAAVTKH